MGEQARFNEVARQQQAADANRIADLERRLASALLTGNENAVNCDAHGEPIAYIPANGDCPACELERRLAEAGGAAMANEQKIEEQRALIFELREGISDVDLWETLVQRAVTAEAKLAEAEHDRDAARSLNKGAKRFREMYEQAEAKLAEAEAKECACEPDWDIQVARARAEQAEREAASLALRAGTAERERDEACAALVSAQGRVAGLLADRDDALRRVGKLELQAQQDARAIAEEIQNRDKARTERDEAKARARKWKTACHKAEGETHAAERERDAALALLREVQLRDGYTDAEEYWIKRRDALLKEHD